MMRIQLAIDKTACNIQDYGKEPELLGGERLGQLFYKEAYQYVSVNYDGIPYFVRLRRMWTIMSKEADKFIVVNNNYEYNFSS